MYYVRKRVEISYAHQLHLPYESKCNRPHGHNAIIEVYCKAEQLNENGMVVDFSEIKRIVKQLDHRNLNEIFNFPTTAENVAQWLCQQIPSCYKISFQESDGNLAIYEKERL